MYNNKQKQVIVAGNDFKIKFSLKKFDSGEYVPFDLSTCTDLHVLLISSQEIDLKYEILQSGTNTILATVDYRLVRPNTAYGFAVEGNDADGNHFRWEMRPSEGIYVVTNTSGMHITEDTYTIDIEGRVGWGYDGYTKAEIDEKFTAVDNDIDRIDISIQGIDGDISELGRLVDGMSGDITDLQNNKQNKMYAGAGIDIVNNDTITIDTNVVATQSDLSDKQDTLVSAQNIKTINGISVLGSGNIEIQGGSGVQQVQTDWNQTNVQAVDFIKNKPDLSLKQDKLTAGSNITIDSDNTIYATYSAGAGIDIVNNDTITIDTTVVATQTDLADKQDTLVSAQNIKTINSQSILGSGNIDIQQVQTDWNQTNVQAVDYIKNKPDLSLKQDKLTAGSNITIDYDNTIYATYSAGTGIDIVNNDTITIDTNVVATQSDLSDKQDTLVSAQNIKTINGISVLGSGNIEIQGGSGVQQVQTDWNQTNVQAVDFIKNKPDLDTVNEIVTIVLTDHEDKINEINNTVPQQISQLSTDTDTKITNLTNTVNSSLNSLSEEIDESNSNLVSVLNAIDSQTVKTSMTGLQIEVVAQMPAVPAQNTIYIVQ